MNGGYSNQVLKLDIPGDLPISLEAHYDIEVYGDKASGEMSYEIKLGYVEWTLAHHKMPDLEGKEIPQLMLDKILGAITITSEEMSQALNDAEADEDHYRSHAVGF